MNLTLSVVWFFMMMGDPEALREAVDAVGETVNKAGYELLPREHYSIEIDELSGAHQCIWLSRDRI